MMLILLIIDFNIADDVIQLENSIMTSIGLTTGALAATEFFVGAAAHDANDSIIYNRSTGALLPAPCRSRRLALPHIQH
jgi:serralysin